MRDVKSKTSLYGYSDSKMKTRVSANLLCEGAGVLGTQEEEAEELSSSFASVFTCKLCTQSSLAPDLNGRLWDISIVQSRRLRTVKQTGCAQVHGVRWDASEGAEKTGWCHCESILCQLFMAAN